MVDKQVGRFWTLDEPYLYYIDLSAQPRAHIRRMDLAGGNRTDIGEVAKKLPPGLSGLSVSPDGKWISYPQLDQENTRIMTVENLTW